MKNIYKYLLALLMVAAIPAGKKAQAQSNSGFEYSTKCLTVSLWATDKRAYDSCAQVKYAVNNTYVSGVQASYTFTTSGTYTICMKILNTCRKWDTSICKTVTVKSCDTNSCNLKPDFSWKNDCLKAKFIATGGISGASYSWSFGDGTGGSGLDPTHSYTKSGVYKVCLTMKWVDKNTGATCVKTVCKEIKISCGTPCNIKGDFQFAVHAGYAKFVAYSNTGYYYEWSFGDGTYGTGQTPVHQYKKPGTYTVCVKIYDKTKKCSVKICKTVVVPEPCNVRATFVWKASSNTVKFNAVAYNGYKFVWDFGDGTYGFGMDPSHTYSKPGTYKVCLTVYSKSGKCKTTVCKTVVISGGTTKCNWAAMGAGFGYNIVCPKLTLEAKTLMNGSNCIKYTWAITPANTSQTTYFHGRVQSIQFSSNGVYNVCLKLTDSCNKCDTIICKTITINCGTKKCDWSKAGFGYAVNCRKAVFEGYNMGTGCYKYYWSINGTVYNGRIAYYQFTKDGIYKICYKVVDTCNNCDTMICKEIKVACDTNKCDWSKAGFDVKVDCKKITAEAYNLGGCQVYYFALGNTTGSYGRLFSYEVSQNGSYTLCLKIKDTCNNCDTMICKTVKVDCTPKCNWTGAGFTYGNKCRDFVFEAKNLNNSCIKYFWSVGGSSAGSGRVLYYNFSKTGTYVVCLKMYDTCNKCDTSICQNIKVDCNPCSATAKFTVDSVNKSGIAYLTNHSSGAYYYAWDFGDSTFSYVKSPGKHAYSSSGTRTICLTVWDSAKTCSTKYCVTIQVVKSRSNAASVSTASAPNIQIYPNPAADYFTIYLGESSGSYEVMNLQGKIITSGTAAHEAKVLTADWAEGIYLVKTLVNGAQSTTRVVVVRQ